MKHTHGSHHSHSTVSPSQISLPLILPKDDAHEETVAVNRVPTSTVQSIQKLHKLYTMQGISLLLLLYPLSISYRDSPFKSLFEYLLKRPYLGYKTFKKMQFAPRDSATTTQQDEKTKRILYKNLDTSPTPIVLEATDRYLASPISEFRRRLTPRSMTQRSLSRNRSEGRSPTSNADQSMSPQEFRIELQLMEELFSNDEGGEEFQELIDTKEELDALKLRQNLQSRILRETKHLLFNRSMIQFNRRKNPATPCRNSKKTGDSGFATLACQDQTPIKMNSLGSEPEVNFRNSNRESVQTGVGLITPTKGLLATSYQIDSDAKINNSGLVTETDKLTNVCEFNDKANADELDDILHEENTGKICEARIS